MPCLIDVSGQVDADFVAAGVEEAQFHSGGVARVLEGDATREWPSTTTAAGQGNSVLRMKTTGGGQYPGLIVEMALRAGGIRVQVDVSEDRNSWQESQIFTRKMLLLTDPYATDISVILQRLHRPGVSSCLAHVRSGNAYSISGTRGIEWIVATSRNRCWV